jgi:hypothetical protein
MIIVPVAGDTLKTVDGLPFKVVSFTNNKSEGPAVLATPTSGGESIPIFFETIAELNGKKVHYVKSAHGYKVFDTDGYIKRDYQLPQPGTFVEANLGVETRSYKVKRIRVNVPNLTASGMILDAEDKDDNSEVTITLNQITNIDQTLFKQKGFITYYADYTPKGTA